MNYSYCIMQMSDGHFLYNDVECDTHGLTTVNKRVETLKSCRRHAKGVVTKVISPLRLLVIILLLLKSNIQFHHECYRTIAALLAQQVVHHKLESDSLCHFHAEVIAYMFVRRWPIRWDLKIRRSSPNSLNGSPALLRRNIENINLPDTFSFAASTLSGSFRNCPYR